MTQLSLDHPEIKKRFLEYLLEFISDNKKEKFSELIRHRTRYITVALEDIYQPHNASAVLRTCDCLGIQDVHIIEDRNRYKVNPQVALGASKWLTLTRYSGSSGNAAECIQRLREKRYRIIATSSHEKSADLHDLEINEGKLAVVLGTEESGLSKGIIEQADATVKIPMYGFTESYNISVSAALILFHLTEKLRISEIDWHLAEDESLDVLTCWAKNSLKRPTSYERAFLRQLKREGF